MILAVDVHYVGSVGHCAGVGFEDWASKKPTEEFLHNYQNPMDYVPGEFFKRELPCILALQEKYSLNPSVMIVDGYVSLGGQQNPGLGKYLHDAMGKNIPVIGVAKSAFPNTPADWRVFRGKSAKPLYVTAIGLPISQAKQYISQMHGPFRIPTLLKRVDYLARSAVT